MKILTLDFRVKYTIIIKLKGLSFKNAPISDLIKCDFQKSGYCFEVREYYIDKVTAYPQYKKVLSLIQELYDCVKFDKIKIKNNRHISADKLYSDIKK